jgi:hypothetical protein
MIRTLLVVSAAAAALAVAVSARPDAASAEFVPVTPLKADVAISLAPDAFVLRNARPFLVSAPQAETGWFLLGVTEKYRMCPYCSLLTKTSTRLVSTIAPGAGSWIPYARQPGCESVLAYADSTDLVDERDETNNTVYFAC